MAGKLSDTITMRMNQGMTRREATILVTGSPPVKRKKNVKSKAKTRKKKIV